LPLEIFSQTWMTLSKISWPPPVMMSHQESSNLKVPRLF